MKGYKTIEDYTFDECLSYMEKFPNGNNIQEVTDRYNELLQKLQKDDDAMFTNCRTITDLEQYINYYAQPSSSSGYEPQHLDEARAKVEYLYFETCKASIKGCSRYLQKYPSGQFADRAQVNIRQYKKSRRKKIITYMSLAFLVAAIVTLFNYNPVTYLTIISSEKTIGKNGGQVLCFIATDAQKIRVHPRVHPFYYDYSIESDTLPILPNDIEPDDLKVIRIMIPRNTDSTKVHNLEICAYSSLFGNMLHSSELVEEFKIIQESGIERPQMYREVRAPILSENNKRSNRICRILKDVCDIEPELEDGVVLTRFGLWDYGFLDKDGNEVTKERYQDARRPSWGFAPICVNNKWGYVCLYKTFDDIPCIYDSVGDFSDCLASVCLDGKYGYISFSGHVVIPIMYDYADDFKDGVAKVKLGDKVGVINKRNEIVMPFDDCSYYYIYDDIILRHKKYNVAGGIDIEASYYTTNGKFIATYDYGQWFQDGVAAVEVNDKWGYIDRNGFQETLFEYEDADYASWGLLPVKYNGKWGAINKYNCQHIVIPFEWDAIGQIERVEGSNRCLIIVKSGDKEGCITNRNKTVLPCRYNDIKIIGEYLLVRNSGQKALYDLYGNQIVPMGEYYDIMPTPFDIIVADEVGHGNIFFDNKGHRIKI